MISGYTITRDCVSYDYCVEACIRSMLPFCEEVVVCDAMSQDGTRELVESIAEETGKVRLVDYPRKELIFNERDHISRWANSAREHLSHDYQFYLEADEVAGPRTGAALAAAEKAGSAAECHRLTFMRDASTLKPEKTICSDWVVRSGPTGMWMPMDCPNLTERCGEYAPLLAKSEIEIFHYGMLRTPAAFVRKSLYLQPALVGAVDARLVAAAQSGRNWMENIKMDAPYVPFTGCHPHFAIQWLRDRGHNPKESK